MGLTVKIVTFFDEAFASLGELTSTVAHDYAARYGCRFHCYRKALLPDRHVYWNKLAILLREIHQSDYTIWLDADVLMVGRRGIEDLLLDKELVLSQDRDGLCCGVILVRNTQWVRRFLEAWLLLGAVDADQSHRYEDRNLGDQTAFKCLVSNFPAIRSRIGTWPESVVLNPRAEYCDDPFLMHYWASSGRFREIFDRITLFRQTGWSRQCFLEFSNSGEAAVPSSSPSQ